MLRYYKKALRELEEKSNGKYQVEEHYHKQGLNNYGGEVEEDSREDLSKESKVRESSHKHGNKRDKEIRRKKKKTKKTTETATRHDDVTDEVRKKTKKEKKRRLGNIDVEVTTSDDRESCQTKFKKSRIDPPIVSNSKEFKKKRKLDYLSELSEGAVKKIKRSVQTTESEKHRDEEKCGEIYISCNQRTENAHTSVESSSLERSRYSYAISPSGGSLQSNSHHSKKVSGKVTKDGHKKKKKKKRTEDLTTNKVDLADGNYNKTDATESIVEPSFISTMKMDKAKLREATVNSNKIQETWRLSKERLKALAEQGIKVKKGQWSKQELELLKSNMACYLERYNLPSPTNLLFTCNATMDAEERLYWRRFANSTDFYKELGKGIQRELIAIYTCTNRIFDKTNYVGRYSENEIKELKRLRAIHGRDWVTIGKIMVRSCYSIFNRYSSIPPKGEKLAQKGKWTDDEVKRLKEAVHTVTKTSASDEQSIFHGIPWQSVAELVMTRNRIKCRAKWLDQLCWSTAADNTQGKHWTKSHDLKLITRLYNSGVMEECDVDWMELKSEYEINYSPQWLHKKWSKLKKGVPDYQQLSFEDIVDYLYLVYGQTLRDEIETGTPIKDTDTCDVS